MNKTAFITGTNRGIGKATVSVFAARQWNIFAHARKRTQAFEDYLAETATMHSVSIRPIYFDMLDTGAMKETIRELRREHITIHALINNAGISHGGLFQMTPVSAIQHIFSVNLFAHMELTQLVLRMMAKENSCIVNVASVAGIDMRSGNAAYGVSKAALIAWTKVLQVELHGSVRVNVVASGLTETEMAQEMQEKLQAMTLAHEAGNRLAVAFPIRWTEKSEKKRVKTAGEQENRDITRGFERSKIFRRHWAPTRQSWNEA